MTEIESAPGGVSRKSFYTFVTAVAFSPYYIVAHELLGRPTLFGKALFLVGLTAAVSALFAFHARVILRRLSGELLLGVWLAAIAVLLVRSIVYNVPIDLFVYRFAFLGFVYVFVALPFAQSPQFAPALRRVLLWSCIVQAVLGIIHNRYFPYIVTGVPLDGTGQAIYLVKPGMGGYRENGTLISANMYGAFLVLGLVLLFVPVRKLTVSSALRVGPVAVLLWWGVVLSGSRFALGGAAITTCYLFLRSAPGYALPIVLPIAATMFLTSSAMTRVEQRFAAEGSGGRVAIATVSAELATRRLSSLLVGVPAAEQASARTASGQILSDNSYASLMLNYGLPFTLLLLFYVGIAWSSVVRIQGWVVVVLVFIAAQFAVTNALYWDPFVLFAGATVLVVDFTEHSHSPERVAAPDPGLRA